jgi:hypothetical protein
MDYLLFSTAIHLRTATSGEDRRTEDMRIEGRKR